MPSPSEPVIVTVAYGQFNTYLSGWLRNLRATGCHASVHLLALDNAEHDITEQNITIHRRSLPRLERWSGDFLRLELIRELNAAGHICVQIDLDIFFNANPLTYCRIPYDFIISRGLGFPAAAIQHWGFSLCTGFYIVKPGAKELLDAWFQRREQSGGLDQVSLNAMMLEQGVRWLHDRSEWVRDALLISDDRRICVLSDRALTRDCSFESFGGMHHKTMLAKHL